MPIQTAREEESGTHEELSASEPADPDIPEAGNGQQFSHAEQVMPNDAAVAQRDDCLSGNSVASEGASDGCAITDASDSDNPATEAPDDVHAYAEFMGDADEEEQVWIHGDPDDDDDEIDHNVIDTYSVAFQRREERRNAPNPTPREIVLSNFTVVAAVVAGMLVSGVKFAASFFTGSVAMFSEGVHSLVDAINDSLLLVGSRVSKKEPDVDHPFGYGRELYFYTFVVAVVIFLFGGGFTIYRGVSAFLAGGTVVESPMVNYVVLLVAIVIEGFSFVVALRDVNNSRQGQPLFEYIRESKSPAKFTVLLEDSVAELGMIIAFAGIFFSLQLGIPQLDSIASIIIGLLMAIVAMLLLRETRSLLIGEGLTREEVEDVVFIVEQDPAVIKCGRVLSMYMGPTDMLLNLDVTFDDELDEGDVLQAIDRIEGELIDDYPQCSSIFIEAESLNQVYRQRHDRRKVFEAGDDDEESRERERELERERALRKAEKRKAKKKAAQKKVKKKKKKARARAAVE